MSRTELTRLTPDDQKPCHARALLPLGNEREQLAMCQQIEVEALSVRATEELVQELIRADEGQQLKIVGGTSKKPNARRARSEQVANLEQQLRAALGVKIDLKQSTGGGGKITVHFKNHGEFERIFTEITGKKARNVG